MDESDSISNIVSAPGNRDCVIEVRGDLDGQTLRGLLRLLLEAMAEHPDEVILDLTDVRFYDASLLAVVLAEVRQHGLDIGVRLLLEAPRETISGLLATPGMDLMLPTVPTAARQADRPRPPFPTR